MKKYGIKIGSTVERFTGFCKGVYIVARATRRYVTLFSPDLGVCTITRRQFFTRGPLILLDESWMFFVLPEQMEEYHNRLDVAAKQAKDSFLSYLDHKKWKHGRQYDGYGYAACITPTPPPKYDVKDQAMRRGRKYNSAVFTATQTLEDIERGKNNENANVINNLQ